MVRLVFRPYTKIRPLICTLKPLRASIRVSSDFALFWHSSPSFGSQHIRSYSVLKHRYIQKNISLSFRQSTLQSVRLAYMLDSLVRVSRRVGRFGFYFFQELLDFPLPSCPVRGCLAWLASLGFSPPTLACPPASRTRSPALRPFSFYRSPRRLVRVQLTGYNNSCESTFLSPATPPLQPWPPESASLLPRKTRLPRRPLRLRLSALLLSRQQPSAYLTINGFTSSSHSLSKVLFIFPSRYLFAIGVVSVFSFR